MDRENRARPPPQDWPGPQSASRGLLLIWFKHSRSYKFKTSCKVQTAQQIFVLIRFQQPPFIISENRLHANPNVFTPMDGFFFNIFYSKWSSWFLVCLGEDGGVFPGFLLFEDFKLTKSSDHNHTRCEVESIMCIAEDKKISTHPNWVMQTKNAVNLGPSVKCVSSPS